ncbi:MAG: tyrosine-type recombinase/integrase [Rhodospirillaceae bacterium]|nr:tyrosine-type recombinase/integrase [Rhodospirillaceae bacterium]
MSTPYRNPYPGVAEVRDRHGKPRLRLRRTINGVKIDVYLPSPRGSAEFRESYEQEIDKALACSPQAAPGTFAFLISTYLRTAAYRNLAESTRTTKRQRLDWIRENIGQGRYATMQPRHIETLMERKGGPEAANRLRKDLRQLFDFAAKRFGFKEPNPATLADPHKVKSSGYHTWTDEEIATYRDAHPTGSKARLAFELVLNTGAARQDAARMTRGNIRGNRICYRRGKTGQETDLPILKELARELAVLPMKQMVIVSTGNDGRAFSVAGFGNWFRQCVADAGLPAHCSIHGLRKAGARRLAEAGATEFEIMAFLAHSSAKEASRYTAAANRSKLTDAGMAKLDEGGTGLTNRPRLVCPTSD